VGRREPGELGGVLARLRGDVEAVEVDVEGRGPVDLVDAVVGAAGDQHRLADAAPAMADADPERRLGPDRGRDDRV
jgi:hypothetical protein